MEDLKKKIIDLFFNEHLKVKDIANRLQISSAYITKIIQKRERIRIEDNYYAVQAQHNQAISELSKRTHLTNENYRKWNYSAYKYNPSKHRYEFNDALGRSYDVPKYVKER